MNLISVYIPCKNQKEAEKISKILLEKKLIACSNVFNAKSFYMWKGKPAKEKEAIIFAKTASSKYKKIISQVKKIHSYELPAILKFNINANKEYKKWVLDELK